MSGGSARIEHCYAAGHRITSELRVEERCVPRLRRERGGGRLATVCLVLYTARPTPTIASQPQSRAVSMYKELWTERAAVKAEL